MSPNEMMGSTSRSALILGMTDTDQIGLLQAKAPAVVQPPPAGAEVLPDAGDAADAGGGDGGDEIDDATGLTAAEQAEFDAMRRGEEIAPEPPAGDDAGGDDDTGDDDAAAGDAGDDATAGEVAPAARTAKEKTPAELAAEAAPGQKPPPKTISYGRYQRDLKKAADRQAAAEARAQKAHDDAVKLSERVAIINEALQAPPPAPPPDPNAPPENPFEEEDIDPTVDYAASVLQERRRNKYVYEQNQQTRETVTETEEDRALKDTFNRDFQATAVKQPTLPAAYQFLKDSRLTEICISEFDKDPNDENEVFTPQEVAKMVQIFNAEEKWVVNNALKQGKSPSLAILKLARSRGFKPAAAAPQPAPRAPGGSPPARVNGARAPTAPAAPAPISAAAQLAELQAATDAAKSLSDGGGAPPQGLSAEMLLRLNDDEFAEMIDSLPKHQLDALLGR